MHSFRLQGLLALGAVAMTGCYGAELDPALPGVFACEVDDDCPGDNRCDGQVCLEPDVLPTAKLLSPEDGTRLDAGPSTISVQGTLTLVAPGVPVVPGEGYLEVSVGGATRQLTEGDLSVGLAVDLMELVGANEVARRGGHRVRLRAFRSDGTPYGNPEAINREVYWVTPEANETLVTFLQPWPDEALSTAAGPVAVELATLNFAFNEANGVVTGGNGHAHVHYADMLPECTEDVDCDPGYIAIVAPTSGNTGNSLAAEVNFPAGTESMVELSVVLRNNDHSPYRIPFNPPDPSVGSPVFDTIIIRRE